MISTGRGPGDVGPGGQRVVYAFDVQDKKVANQRLFSDMMLDGVKCGPDGMRADVTGNLWCSSNAPLGYAGVLVFNPGAKLIGRWRNETVRLSERTGSGLAGLFRELWLVTRGEVEELELRIAQLEHRLRLLEK